MSKRTYNIFYNLHTVSGIVISVGLFVIFFAGAFTLFYKETEEWERSQAPTAAVAPAKLLHLDTLVSTLTKAGNDLYARDIYIDLQAKSLLQPVFLGRSEDSLATGAATKFKSLYVDRDSYAITEQSAKSSATLGALLYELHFLEQLGDPGYYLAGLISLFLLFAVVTGIIIHWKKIISNFYLFRPYEKLKTVWTDAHTALGMIGIPFQFMYALTGAWFGLSILVASSGSLLYNGNQSKYYEEIFGHHEAYPGPRIDLGTHSLQAFVDSASSRWDGFRLTYIAFHGTGSANMKVNIYGEVDSRSGFFNFGELEFDVATGTVTHLEDPFHKSYDDLVSAAVHRLHFGYFGLDGWRHMAVKVLYFLLAMATCFVIITGVLIWLEARKKKPFSQAVGHIYLPVCLSMLPITALSYLVSRLTPASLGDYRAMVLNCVFFGGWLLMAVFFWYRKNNYLTNKYTLLLAGILGACVPVAGYAMAGQFVFVDGLWTGLSVTALLAVWMAGRRSAATAG
ncbi:PepSY domain-containing protein [Chitinophaga horti]|uniref:PepSY domain-containing protein n=1 Tax=Chitinophaga horti TaxID=2920382 RepID=A0ABY6JBP8_9BACT|nr:PepSY-associated TM helix domain-containing protein [Chitinophaga horti]UYQ95619.1 PepSY domain-containing protein [Chitinophaga horti]